MKNSATTQRIQAGFTLVELLTVIAVIAVLGSILIAAVGSVKAKSNTVQCASNLRQLATAAMIYANDNGGQFLAPVNNTNGVRKWMLNGKYLETLGEQTALQDINAGENQTLSDLSVSFRCPTAEGDHSELMVNYGMNATGLDLEQLNEEGYAPRISPKDPAKVVYLMDALDWAVAQSNAGTKFTSEAAASLTPAYRHDGGLNAAFFDGHVEFLTPEDLTNNPQRWELNI